MKISSWAAAIGVLAMVTSCYPEKERTIDDFDIVGTTFDDKVDFSQYKTFAMEDSLILVYHTTEDAPEYPTTIANTTLDAIRNNMLSYGWTEITENDTAGGVKPDVVIGAYAWSTTVSGTIFYPYYPYWGYGWYYPYYGYGGGVSYYSYSTGTLFIEFFDLKNPNDTEQRINIIWSAGINGITETTISDITGRVKFSVNQAFSQSPYLKLN